MNYMISVCLYSISLSRRKALRSGQSCDEFRAPKPVFLNLWLATPVRSEDPVTEGAYQIS